jgi:putative cell wall-binding protein
MRVWKNLSSKTATVLAGLSLTVGLMAAAPQTTVAPDPVVAAAPTAAPDGTPASTTELEATPAPTSAPTSSSAPVPDATPTPTPDVTATPDATATPTPVATTPEPAATTPPVTEAEPNIRGINTYSFRADDIISDKNMYNGAALDAAAVQSFLTSQVPACDNAKCLAGPSRFSVPTIPKDAQCAAYTGGSQTAATVIANVGKACGVSQKALLALIEKESGLVTSTAPTAGRLDAATGYDCRDDGTPCDEDTRGFFNQVYNAARQLKSDFQNPRLPIGSPTAVRYHPDESCGSAPLTIRTKATAALYKYTPYQPNAAALDSQSNGDACSSFGNLNFWVIYTDWFGYPHIDVDRLAGQTRYDVAVAIAKEAYPNGAQTVFLAFGGGYADALSAGPAAVKLNAPLLLTGTDAIPPAVATAIRDSLKPSTIVVVGGPNSVSETVVEQLRSLRKSQGVTITVDRWGGADRYAVSRTVAARAFGTGNSGAYVATGTTFPDALSASGAGGATNRPVVLVYGPAASVDQATATLLTSTLRVKNVTIAGGPNSVSAGLQSSLGGLRTGGSPIGVRRISGADRYEASLAINLDAYDYDVTGVRRERVFVATGLNFPDALAGSALAGAKDSPLVVVRSTCVSSEFRLSLQRFRAERVTLLGGANSLGAGVASLTACT